MASLAPIDWKRFEKFLTYIGCKFIRQRGSHRMFDRDGLSRPLVIVSGKQLAVGHIRSNLRSLKMSDDTYLEILEKL